MADRPAAAAPDGRLAALRERARRQLAAERWHYLEAGCGEDHTRRANVEAFARRALWPRPLADLRGGHTRLSLLGRRLDHPILLAPIAYQRLYHPGGECASAMAAAAQGGLTVVSSLASQPIERIVAAAEGAAWFQLYWQRSRDDSLHLAQRALDAGCSAIVFTVDAPVKAATFALPHGVAAVNLGGAADVPAPPAGGSLVFDGWMTRAPTWDDLAWLRSRLGAPLLVKGLLQPDDAQRALACGCDGVIVSNHGGRVLDGVPASLDALPAVVDRISGRCPVLFDSGIRSGRDVFQALALGATAVLLGRPYVWGLAANGALGVAEVIRIVRDELEMTMALTGCAELRQVRHPNGHPGGGSG